MSETGRRRIRRLYYTGSIILLFIIAVSLSIPACFEIKRELQTKIEQLSKGIIDQKEILLKTIITEKISDIIQLRKDLSVREPNLKDEEFDHVFRMAVRNMIYSIELPDNGYIWINEIIDYQGGDNYAIRLVHPNLIETEGEVFSDYYFKKKDLNIISHKLSYAKLYEPYNWIVATGVYLDDVDRLIEAETVNMKASAQKSIRNIIFTVLSSSVILAGMMLLFENRIQAVLNRYLSALQRLNHGIRKEKIKLEISRTKREKSSFGHEAGDYILKSLDNYSGGLFHVN